MDKIKSANDPFSALELPLQRLLRFNLENPDRVCATILDENGDVAVELRIQTWIEKAKRVAMSLSAQGVKQNDCVILSLPTSEEFLVSFLALWWIGAIPVPLPEPSPRIKQGSFHERLIHVISDCNPKGIILPEKGVSLLSEIPELAHSLANVKLWNWKDLWSDSNPASLGDQTNRSKLLNEPVSFTEQSVAFIQYTSGSTGIPKGVVVTQGTLRANSEAMGRASQMSEKDKILTWMPLYHDMGLVGGVFFPCYFKTPFFLMATSTFLSNPKIWLKAISKHKITLSTAPNFVYNLCARRIKGTDIPNLDLSSWRLAYNGSEPIDSETLKLFCETFSPFGFSKNAFYPVYGMAEATLAIAFPPPSSFMLVDQVKRKDLIEGGVAVATQGGNEETISLMSVGQCLPHHQILIKDPHSEKILDERHVGEICFSGPSVTPGYFNDGKWRDQPRTELRTGDLGYLAEGNLYIVDRIKDIILIAGSNFYPSDIERQIHKIPGIRPGRSVAFGVSESEKGTSALVILAEIVKEAKEEELRKEIRARIFASHGLIPRDIVLTHEKAIPLTSSGKVMRRRCHDLYVKGQLVS